MHPLELFDRWARTAYMTTPSSLGLYRIVFALIMLIVALPNGDWVASFPNSFFNPPLGPTFFFFRGFPGPVFLHFLNGLLVFLIVCLLFGYQTRTVSISFSTVFVFLRAWEYSFGKINHDFITLLIPILFAWAGWGDFWSIDSAKQQKVTSSANGAPIALYAFIVSVMMLSAGVPKVFTGWLSPRTHAVQADIIVSHFITGRATWFSQAVLGIRSGLFWEPLDWFACIIEIAFVCTFFKRPLLRVVCAFATFFHFGISLLMKIYFWGNILAYGAFADWDKMSEFFPYSLVRRLAALISRTPRPLVLTIAAVIATIYSTYGNPLINLVGKTSEESESRIGLCIIALGSITALIYLVRHFRDTPQIPKRSCLQSLSHR